MKKAIVILGVLLVLTLAFCAWVIYVGIDHTADVNALAQANFRLANQLLFDGLHRKTIDIYVWHTNTPRQYEISGHTIRVIPLVNDDEKATFGNSNFLAHNNACVLMHACSVWDEDKELALSLLNVLSTIDVSAKALWTEVNPDGSLTAEGREWVDSSKWQHGLRAKEFGDQTQKTSNNPLLHTAGSRATAQHPAAGER